MESDPQNVEILDLASFFKVLKRIIEEGAEGNWCKYVSSPRGTALMICHYAPPSNLLITLAGVYLLERGAENQWFVSTFLLSPDEADHREDAQFLDLLRGYFERAMDVYLLPDRALREIPALENELATGSTDARRSAAIRLGELGYKSMVDPLIYALLHDSDNTVRMNAALSLARIPSERAVPPLIKTIRSYLGSRVNHSLAVASAKALGNIGNREALSWLKELASHFRRSGLREEGESVRHAIRRIKGEEAATELYCPVCNSLLEEAEELVKCPNCGVLSHKEHMLEWLHVKNYCPSCHQHLDESLVKPAKLTFKTTKPSRRPRTTRPLHNDLAR